MTLKRQAMLRDGTMVLICNSSQRLALPMPVTVEPYGKDPILLVTFTDEMTLETVSEMYHQSAALVETFNAERTWRIIDMMQTKPSFADIVNIVKNVHPEQPGSFSDPRIHTVFAGLHPMANLLRDLLAKDANGHADIMVYPGFGEALMFAMEDIYDRLARSGDA